MKHCILICAVTIASSISAISQSSNGIQKSFAVSTDSIHIVYEVHGEGMPALVFVHGWSCDRSYWKAQTESFSRKYKVIAIDLAGHGESGIGRKAWTIEAFGKDVASVVEKLGLRRVILIGHSMGGDVIAEAALQLKGRVLGLVMIETYKELGAGRSPEQVQAFLSRFRSDFTVSTRVLVRSMFLPNCDTALENWVAKDMSSAPPDIALPSLEARLNYSREMPGMLEVLKLPVIAINAGNAPTDSASMKRYGVEVMVMPALGHFMMMEDPESFNRVLSQAVAKLSK